MDIPFLSYFKKVRTQMVAPKEPPAVVVKRTPPVEKPSGERLSKTVMPNAVRSLSPQDPFELASRSSGMGGSTAVAAPPSSSQSRTIAFGAPQGTPFRLSELPPAVALALEPNVERVISIELADVIAQMPFGYLKPVESIDGTRSILVKATEVEKGMSVGRPSVSLPSIYQQIPEIFLRTVVPSDATQILLPFAKVLEQFSKLRVRSDQERAPAVPQVETPFLHVTLEDNARFGTTTEELETHDLPAVRVETATAEAFAAAEPEPAAHEKFSVPTSRGSNGFAPPSAPARARSTPSRIPFRLTPNGTDVPAPESVPASSGPSVPTSLPSGSGPAPTRIPFKMVPEEQPAQPEPWITAETEAAAAATNGMKIVLPLRMILQTLPPFQLEGDPAIVPEEAKIELPFSLIEPQLALGRISVLPSIFAAGLPPEYRSLVKTDASGAEILLPLQEVLKNLPMASLRMREDQEEQEAGSNFATPFSAKAAEDAERLKVAATPIAKPVETEVAPVSEAPVEAASPATETPAVPPARARKKKPSERPLRTPLQVALDTDDQLDAKGVVDLINKMPGVKACAMMFGDGLSLAGNLPAELEADGLCAMAPSLLQRIENHMVETKLGELRGMTLSCAKGALTFFMHDNLCLAAFHGSDALTTEIREKLANVALELSRKYSHPV